MANQANDVLKNTNTTPSTPESDGQKKNDVTKTSKGRGRKQEPLLQACSYGRRMFGRQLQSHQNTNTKRECLMEGARRSYNDPIRVFGDLLTVAERLTDSKRFCKECEAEGLKSEHIAQHVAMEGSRVVNNVLKHGVLAMLGKTIKMFTEPLVPADYLEWAKRTAKTEPAI